MLVPSDLRNGGVQDQLPVALYRKYGRAPIILLASSNDGFRPEPPFVTRFTNGLSWSRAAASFPTTVTQKATFVVSWPLSKFGHLFISANQKNGDLPSM